MSEPNVTRKPHTALVMACRRHPDDPQVVLSTRLRGSRRHLSERGRQYLSFPWIFISCCMT